MIYLLYLSSSFLKFDIAAVVAERKEMDHLDVDSS